MPANPVRLAPDHAALDDAGLAARVAGGDRAAFGELMRRCNQRLFRVARGLMRDDTEAEDVVQEAYMHAYEKIAGYRGEASLLTWLTRIVLNEAQGRLRRRRPTVDIDALEHAAAADEGRVLAFPARTEEPAAAAARAQVRRLLEDAVATLPAPFRVVFILREIEECSVEETALALELRPETVKTRLYRARRLLRAALQETLAPSLTEAFPFLGARCERMTRTVLQRLDAAHPASRRSR